MVGRRGEAPLVPPYKFRSPNKAMALDGRGVHPTSHLECCPKTELAATGVEILPWVPRSRLCVAMPALQPKHGHAKP